jgi:hypothetical protein
MPKHLKSNEPRLFLLRRWANLLAARFGASVYLVGSALRDDNANPRDWDVRIPLTNEQFALRYATAGQRVRMSGSQIADLWNEQYYGRTGDDRRVYWRWTRECQRTGKEAFRKYLGLYVDFQAYPPREWRSWGDHPYWRINA